MSTDAPARFITLEGGEGAGKSTHAQRLGEALRARGIDAIVTREPGGSPGAEDIRKLLVEGEPARWDAEVETLLMIAARADHLARTIKPALAKGQWVICDRFSDSTYAYQGVGRSVPVQRIDEIQKVAIGDFSPDLTLILDLPVEEGMKRIGTRAHAENRFEKFGPEFHARLRRFFRELAAREPGRCVLIDADASPDTVSDAIWRTVAQRFGIA